MTNIIIVRHGEVAGNTGDKPAFVGWSDLPLTTRGELQSQAVADALHTEDVAAVYSSDLQRARITAERIAQKHDLEVATDVDLREVNYGKWEGLGEAELLSEYSAQWQARQNDPWNVAAVEGECYSQMWARFLPRWEAMVQRHHDETAVFVGHNGLIRMLLCYFVDAPFNNFKRFHVTNCGITRVEIEPPTGGTERVLVKGVNETSHLRNIL